MSGHTPGPWEWDDNWDDLADYSRKAKVEFFHEHAPWVVSTGGGVVLTGEIICKNPLDAKLIAAAPDLLEALKEMYEHFKDTPSMSQASEESGLEPSSSWDYEACDILGHAYNVIAKAEGHKGD